MKFNYEKDFGKKAMLFVNDGNGYLYCDSVLRSLGDSSLDEIINNDDALIILAQNNQIPIRCAIWVENNEWHPIIRFSPNDKYYLMDGDWIFDEELKGDPENVVYVKSQLKCCEQLADIIKNYI